MTAVRERRPPPDRIACVVVIGSSCAGKSTLVDAVRVSDVVSSQRVCVPQRLITRAARIGDNLVENAYVSEAELDAQIRAGTIELHWLRQLGARTVRYAFRRPLEGALPVYAANNAIMMDAAELQPAGALAHALIVGIHAPDDVRASRLQHRSPDLWTQPDEVAHRLRDEPDRALNDAHLVIENHGAGEAHAAAALVEIVRALVA